ncbi:bifunctional nicotinamidase/pyrazinamidase [Sphingobacterium olei]|uniref:nicotinamidase n=1 Tax=Sphingobacterium olei TaxID=2571155 RepID=A0A4U0P414_9SPHI|nr:bifunctional nicotinamidase/pyrazinamidase [Sphingobacterium olei]TJZ62065.1 bifunctional nicotinamidase/pyrazinamidase [Sphingobacterium olei]
MKSLIIVDIQNDFLPGGALEVSKGDEIIPAINQLQREYDLVVATQDWHPSDHQSFALQHPEHNLFDVIDLDGVAQTLWPNHCMQGTLGAELAETLDQHRIETIFRKGMEKQIDSYSGFFDNGKRKATGLHGYLRSRGVIEVHVCGLAADFCVFFTAMDALELGYRTAIISRATKAIDRGEFMNKKEQFVQKGGMLL